MKKFGSLEGNGQTPYAIHLQKSEGLLKMENAERIVPISKEIPKTSVQRPDPTVAVKSDPRDANGSNKNNSDNDNGDNKLKTISMYLQCNKCIHTVISNAELEYDEDDLEIDEMEGGSNDEI